LKKIIHFNLLLFYFIIF